LTAKPEFIWSHCNECGRETKHDIVTRVDRRRTYDEDRYSVDVGSIWKVLQCRGCGEVALHRLDWCSEDDRTEGPGPGTYFPPRVSRRKPAWVDRFDVPYDYKGLLDEVYAALHADSRRLAMMGTRALIDAVIRRTVGDVGGFDKGLDALAAKYVIGERDRAIIEAAVDAGHASAHRGHRPDSDDVNVVIDIVERLIHAEILAEQAQALRAATPPRKRGPAKKAE
jgi:hypothetical protein